MCESPIKHIHCTGRAGQLAKLEHNGATYKVCLECATWFVENANAVACCTDHQTQLVYDSQAQLHCPDCEPQQAPKLIPPVVVDLTRF